MHEYKKYQEGGFDFQMSPFSDPIQKRQLQRKRFKPHTLEDNRVFLRIVSSPHKARHPSTSWTAQWARRAVRLKKSKREEVNKGWGMPWKQRGLQNTVTCSLKIRGRQKSLCWFTRSCMGVCAPPAQSQGEPWCDLGFIYHSENDSDRLATQIANARRRGGHTAQRSGLSESRADRAAGRALQHRCRQQVELLWDPCSHML